MSSHSHWAVSLSISKTLTEKPTDAWHARMTISLWSLWMIPYLLHVPPVLIIIIIIITSHTRLVGNCRAGTPHIHTLDIVMFWTTVLPSPHVFGTVCVCSITYKYDSSPHTTTYMYLPYLTYLIITYIPEIYEIPPSAPGPRARRKDKIKNRQQSIQHINR